jgi:hypothetical protein
MHFLINLYIHELVTAVCLVSAFLYDVWSKGNEIEFIPQTNRICLDMLLHVQGCLQLITLFQLFVINV